MLTYFKGRYGRYGPRVEGRAGVVWARNLNPATNRNLVGICCSQYSVIQQKGERCDD